MTTKRWVRMTVLTGVFAVPFMSAPVGTAVGTDAYWSQAGAVPGSPEPNDRFGSALAVGDFDGDGFDDLAAGAPGEAIGSRASAGAVNVLYGGPTGLTSTGSQFFSQSTSGIAGSAETGDRFGAAVAAGDFDGDGFDDLAIGVPGEAIGSIAEAGMVHVLRGSAGGLVTAGSMHFHQGTPGVNGFVEAFDRFGHSLAAGDLTGTRDDLVVGVPDEDIGGLADAGAAHFVPGSPSGLDLTGEYAFSQDDPGLGSAAAGDRFGWALAIADFDENGPGDLAVSAPWEAVDGGDGMRPSAGVVAVIEGSASGPAPTVATVTVEDGITQLSDPTNRLLGRDLAVRSSTGGVAPFDLVAGVRDSAEGFGGGAEVFRFNGDVGGEGLDPEIGYHPATEPGTAVAGRAMAHGDGESPGVFVGVPRADDGAPASGVVGGWSVLGDLGQAATPGTPEFGDGFASDLVVGDFDDDGLDDLVAGVPGEDIGDLTDAGGLVVAYGVNHPWF